MRFRTLALAGIGAALFAIPAFAHHSFAMFDADKTVTLSGTVKEFEWINPHTWIHLVVTDTSTGKPITWSFEGGSTAQLGSSGWKQDTIKAGDKIDLGYHPLKDGSHGGQLLNIKLADGKTLCQGGACRRAAGGAAAGGGD